MHELKKFMIPHSIFEEIFKKELEGCYKRASSYSEGGDDRNSAMELAKATVFNKLLNYATQ